ncbi:50S ribosomal protein L13 [candidate division WWE3 bacterium CG10_big_fil_rev_8_21_14_0_10_32_10]|uniref:Large ribosomal subunit protein uL13 n=1 Tax=candidate division WWE3 bacterium CG10_big_fil_rev_8_21_14_0_10_32_10 TaxID=1975090 RepID=A0A2H0RB46_UNCKA|nr:MAG: 50S ribosomal protein L13 [candidate division WWE3 bacterium CG10_big_fil_rev_8_21_14_0_10_32_10]
MKTTVTKKSEITQDWHLLDASDLTLGRLSTQATSFLLGKGKTNYTPNMVCGDKVVVVNSDKLKLTGNKVENKMYYRHSGHARGLKSANVSYYLKKDSTFILRNSISGMLPKNRLRDVFLKNLYIYKGAEHPHVAQIKAK